MFYLSVNPPIRYRIFHALEKSFNFLGYTLLMQFFTKYLYNLNKQNFNITIHIQKKLVNFNAKYTNFLFNKIESKICALLLVKYIK